MDIEEGIGYLKRDDIMHKIINNYESQLSVNNDTNGFPSAIKITNVTGHSAKYK